MYIYGDCSFLYIGVLRAGQCCTRCCTQCAFPASREATDPLQRYLPTPHLDYFAKYNSLFLYSRCVHRVYDLKVIHWSFLAGTISLGPPRWLRSLPESSPESDEIPRHTHTHTNSAMVYVKKRWTHIWEKRKSNVEKEMRLLFVVGLGVELFLRAEEWPMGLGHGDLPRHPVLLFAKLQKHKCNMLLLKSRC